MEMNRCPPRAASRAASFKRFSRSAPVNPAVALALVVAAAQACAALTAHCVDLVDEHDGRGFLLGLVKEVADTAGAHAYIQLHKVGARDRQEVDSGLARHRLGDEGLTGARRANHPHRPHR